MLLSHMQAYLANLYETPTGKNIYDFLITDARLADAMTPYSERGNHERLLIAQSSDGLGISVYVDIETLNLLANDNPFECLHENNLAAFLVALEGVSHFHYLCWNAAFDRPVTLMEMELQAEVDKYVMVISLLVAQGESSAASAMHERLFDHVSYRQGLQQSVLTRYEDANHYARKYCWLLRSDYPGHGLRYAFINELRRFYRLTQNEKIRRIETACF